MRTARWLIALGSLILLLTACLHGSGYRELTSVVEKSGTNPIVVGAFKALWLMFSFHLAILSVVFVVASRARTGNRLVFLLALIPAADSVLLFRFVGIFVGSILLAVAAGLFVVGGLLLAQDSEA